MTLRRRLTWPVLTDALARVCVGVLFTLLTISLTAEFRRTGHVTGLLLVGSEALVVVLTIVRRRTHLVDRSPMAAILTVVSLLGPPLLRPGGIGIASDQLTAIVSAIGFAIVVYGKISLGRSFGLIPANRGVVTAGPYAFVRHPIYSGYLITHVAFIAAYPTTTNIALILLADGALVWRALLEERVLAGDHAYRAYCSRVAWHLVPGVF